MQAIIESIKTMPVNGTRLELPEGQMANYPKVKAHLLKAGGKYKKCGFEFGKCAQEIKDRLVGGEKVNDKKKFQFFPTPEPLAKRMVEMADIQDDDYILEPSAGQGSIAGLLPMKHLFLVELNPDNTAILLGDGYKVKEADFLTLTAEKFGTVDKIVANPPFTKNQDVDHIRHMYSLLNPKGRIVTIASCSWLQGSQKKQVAFREWLDEIGATIEELPAGTFKESGTQIPTTLITIDKGV